ncbi:MAG TPA: hydrogenase 4 subunit B [Aggregatilineaceae bacterium]|nr:hydrogenase 4 subunit B [Aggregatilineaceae bacterium]
MTSFLFLFMILAYTASVLAALIGGQDKLGALGAALGAGAGVALGVSVIASGTPFSRVLPDLIPLTGGFVIRLDALGAFFLILIGLIAIPATIFGVGYTATYENEHVSLRFLGVMFSLFLLSMSLVTMAGNVLTFLLMWEGMSLTSYFLVITENGEESTLRAGLWYAAMTHAGLALLLAAFVLLMNGGSSSFTDLRANSATLPTATRDAIFLLAFFGFGSKAGIVPLHVWLPKAHPAAPSHVSALMSGVMIKLGVYGLLRVVLDLLGGGPAWWGSLILGIGVISALLGILYALMEHDLKRLLAYSSVENIGIILIGVGAGLIFHSYGLMSLAALSLIGGLYHAINHASFKGLLFLGAGSVLYATHTRNMEKMGGLIKPMPWTALFFLIGSVAISALPPLNGFVSEWLVFQSLLAGFNIPKPELAILMPVAVGILALTSGLAAACFVKAFGISFLAIPRSAEAKNAQEAPLSMRIGMAILAVICLGLGVGPVVVVPFLGKTISGLGHLPEATPRFTSDLSLRTPDALGKISPALAAVGLLLLLTLIPIMFSVFRVNRRLRLGETWGCGHTGQTPRMEYTATAFAEPLRRVFAEMYRPTKELSIDFHPDSKYFVESIEYKSEISPLFDRWLYDPFLKSVRFFSRQVQHLQSGSLHLYLVYLIGLLIILLLAARWL